MENRIGSTIIEITTKEGCYEDYSKGVSVSKMSEIDISETLITEIQKYDEDIDSVEDIYIVSIGSPYLNINEISKCRYLSDKIVMDIIELLVFINYLIREENYSEKYIDELVLRHNCISKKQLQIKL